MRESFEYEGTSTGEYREGLYVKYGGKEYPAAYLGVGRFILHSETADKHCTFPADDGTYILQTDLRDTDLTLAWEIRTIGIVKECYENVMVHEIYEEGILISTYHPKLAFQLSLKPVKNLGFTGLVDRNVLIGIYEERDYLWYPGIGIYGTFCEAANIRCDKSWFVDNDRFIQVCMI